MKIKGVISFIFDSIYFLISAAGGLFLFFWVTDKLAVETSTPLVWGLVAVGIYLFPVYKLYSAVDKKLG